ncbi:N-acetylmuramoyl-L-alanine amidase [bacterium]|nr:N-acetylmuramoyl-L-alanine amidase [bacterium]
MKRIIIHWTAGFSVPNSYEKEHYHYLIDKYGKIHEGAFKPIANEKCQTGMYAAHTGGGNTGSIGVALCGMLGYKNRKNIGDYPITKIQFETTMQLCAFLSRKFNIPITKNTVLTHYEFGKLNPNTTSAGKIDMTFIPSYSWVETDEIGKFIRTKIKWYLQKILQGV